MMAPLNQSRALLELIDLRVTFSANGQEVPILNHLVFTLGDQETLGIVGESGCGKSVTAMSILKLLPSPPLRSVTGHIMYRGDDLLSFSNRQMQDIRGKEIALIFQEPMTALNPAITIGDQIMEMIIRHSGVRKKTARARATALLEEVELPNPALRLKSYPHELSGGMRQRAMIAMAISCSPRILIADEPTTALDVTIQAQILELFRKLKQERNMSILFITHDLRVIAEIADRVLVMHEGEIVENARVDSIFHSPVHPCTQKLLSFLPKRSFHGRE